MNGLLIWESSDGVVVLWWGNVEGPARGPLLRAVAACIVAPLLMKSKAQGEMLRFEKMAAVVKNRRRIVKF